tara:strand:+ start:7946 stop:8320 length:375 start_codon:yes stop_codon:yes gene_type:complete
MKKCIKNLTHEIDLADNIESKCVVINFERKIKKEINKQILLYGDNGGLDDYTLKNVDYIIMYYVWKYIDKSVTLEEILVIMYSFYKLEEFYFDPSVFPMTRILYIINNSNINDLLFNILYIINE